MRNISHVFAALTFLACGPKAMNNDSSSGSSSTGEPDGSWAVGYYYRPGGGSPTAFLSTLDVKSDGTVDVRVEGCRGAQQTNVILGWAVVDEDSIVFVASDGSGPAWVESLAEGQSITLSRTDKDHIVSVTRGDTVEDLTKGDYWRTSARRCLVLKDPAGGCDNGTYVEPCSES